MEKSQIRAAIDAVQNSSKIAILTHQNPDADTLGSALALARALRSLGKEAVVISEDVTPEVYQFIPESDTTIRDTERRDFDMGIACDIQEPFRVGESKAPLYSTKYLLTVDHHQTVVPVSGVNSANPSALSAGKPRKEIPEYSGERIYLIDSTAAATAELVAEFIDALGVEIDQVMATQLMAAVVGDTGGFRFPNASPRTFELVARLTMLGASAAEAAQNIYESRSFVATALLGRVLSSIESDPDGCVVWGKVRQVDFRELDASDSDTESIVNQVRMVKTAKVGLLFRELGENEVRVSLRSRPGVDVQKVAVIFGGGGHARSAGCTVNRPLDEAIRLVVDEVRKWTGC